MRLHIRSLSAKQYEALQGLSTLDFVLMFVPIEAALIAAVEKDHDLFQEALEKNIMLVSPSTLMIALRTIQNIWRRDQQNRNAVEIAHKAGALYDKFVGFVQILEEVGRHLDQATSAFRIVHDRLIDGRGNLVRRALELKALGVKSNKQLAKELVERATDEDNSPSSTTGNFL
jgi:DNA recombination protein RmuC